MIVYSRTDQADSFYKSVENEIVFFQKGEFLFHETFKTKEERDERFKELKKD